MAITDHTATSRSSLWTATPPTRNLSAARHLVASIGEPHTNRAAALAGISLANHAIACVLDDDNAFRDDQRHGMPDAYPGTLMAETVQGLLTAAYFLNHYAETLMPEPTG